MTETYALFRTPQAQAEFQAAYAARLADWPAPYQSRRVPTALGPTHVIECGPAQAPPLVLLPGNFATALMWQPCVPLFSQRFRVLAVDILGDLGLTEPGRAPASRADYAAWLGEVLDGLGIEQAGLVSVSYGGALALNFALAAPERVRHLALLAPGVANFGPPTWRWAVRGTPMMLWPAPWSVHWFYAGASLRGYAQDDPLLGLWAIGLRAMRQRVPFHPEFSDLELGRLAPPTLLLIGEREILYDSVAALRRARALVPALTAESVPGSGHSLLNDQPEWVNARILRFLLGSQPQPAPGRVSSAV